MDRREIEEAALKLSQQERAELLQKLVLSLEPPTPEELKQLWLSEAKRRADDLDTGAVQGIPGEKVFQKARSLLK